MVHMGAGLFGVPLPDFGISEAISGVLGNNQRTAQGGSNLIGPMPQAAAPVSGNVLGVTTTQSGPGGAYPVAGGNQARSTNTNQNQVSQQVDQGTNQPSQPSFEDQVNGTYDRLMGDLTNSQNYLTGILGQSRDTQKTGIDTQLNAQLPQYDTYRTNTTQQGNRTLSQLAQDLRDTGMNMMNYLGSRGAGGTSGQQGVAYALAKDFGKNRADVMNQVNTQLGNIDMAEQDLRNTAMTLKSQVDDWYNNNLMNIASQFESQRNSMNYDKAHQLLQHLQDMDSQRTNFVNSIVTNAQNRLQTLNDYRIQLQQSGNFNPQEIAYSETQMIPGQYQQANDIWNAIGGSRKTDQNGNPVLY